MKDNSIIQQCIDGLKHEYVKKELNIMLSHILDIILQVANPYFFIIFFLLFASFIINLAILCIVVYKLIYNKSSKILN